MKRLILFLFLFACCFTSNAQFFQLAEGPVFPDPGPGIAKIVQMKNGTTMFLHINFMKGINIQVYEPEYKARTESLIEPSYGNLQHGKVESIFEIKGDAVVMISNETDTVNELYRLIIDGKSGKLKDQKLIASLQKVVGKKSNVISPNAHNFFVRRDADTENYAVVMFNPFVADTSKRIIMMLYGPDHNEINKGFYASQVEKYKYLQFIDMAVIGDKAHVILYGYNQKAGEAKEGELIIAQLGSSGANVSLNELNFSNDLLVEQGVMRYDPQSKRILLLTTNRVQSDSNKLSSYIGTIDPINRKIESNILINAGAKIKSSYTGLFPKKEYSGLPQNMYFNNNGTFTIVYEEMKIPEKKDTTNQFILSNTAVLTYDREASVVSAFLVPMEQNFAGPPLDPYYYASRDLSGQNFSKNDQYKSSMYISDGHNSFVIINDKQANDFFTGGGKLTSFAGLQDADAYYYHLSGSQVVPKRQYVFGKPAEKSEHHLGLFSVYDYDQANNIFVTLKQENEGTHPGIKLVWLQP